MTLVCDTRLPVADKVWRVLSFTGAMCPTSTAGWVLLTSPFPEGHKVAVNTTMHRLLDALMALIHNNSCALHSSLVNVAAQLSSQG